MSYVQQASTTKVNRYNGLHYDLIGRIGDIARRGFYPPQAASLKKDEIQQINAELEQIAEKMESINVWMDTANKRAAASAVKSA